MGKKEIPSVAVTKTDAATTPNDITTRRILHPFARYTCVRALCFSRCSNTRYAYRSCCCYAKVPPRRCSAAPRGPQPQKGAVEKHPSLSNGSPVHTRSADPLRGDGWTPEAGAMGTRTQERKMVPSHAARATGAAHSAEERGREQ